ncbi:Progestin and adipoQ receptor family member 3 [Blattella germanica]|nr:Progestin and adipoQ receptor family member 3 [Blattella germanica]
MFSVLYHVLLCRSEKDQRFFLILDLFGVFICTLVSFLLSMFYGFICYQNWRIFYMVVVVVLFVQLIIQFCASPSEFGNMMKFISFLSWIACALVANIHWYVLHGGMENKIVRVSA